MVEYFIESQITAITKVSGREDLALVHWGSGGADFRREVDPAKVAVFRVEDIEEVEVGHTIMTYSPCYYVVNASNEVIAGPIEIGKCNPAPYLAAA